MRIGTASATPQALDVVESLPPVPLHESHDYIVVGGYAGCLRCGGVAGIKRSKLLEGACRRYCPVGSRQPINRLERGELPQRALFGTEGQCWPSGELAPRVLRWAPAAQRREAGPADAPVAVAGNETKRRRINEDTTATARAAEPGNTSRLEAVGARIMDRLQARSG